MMPLRLRSALVRICLSVIWVDSTASLDSPSEDLLNAEKNRSCTVSEKLLISLNFQIQLNGSIPLFQIFLEFSFLIFQMFMNQILSNQFDSHLKMISLHHCA